jgi:hypothetical protein
MKDDKVKIWRDEVRGREIWRDEDKIRKFRRDERRRRGRKKRKIPNTVCYILNANIPKALLLIRFLPMFDIEECSRK